MDEKKLNQALLNLFDFDTHLGFSGAFQRIVENAASESDAANKTLAFLKRVAGEPLTAYEEKLVEANDGN
jgi:hypothetical protein